MPNQNRPEPVMEAACQPPADMQQILLDAFPCSALIIKHVSHEIIASNKAAKVFGGIPGTCCHYIMGNQSQCPWCLAGESATSVSEKHIEIEALGRVWEAHWIPIDGERVLHYLLDITERKLTATALHESEERFQRIAETITDYIYSVQFENGKVNETLHSGGCRMVTGYASEEFRANPLLWITMVHPDDRMRVKKTFAELIRTPFTSPIEHRIIRKDGVERWVRNTPVVHFGVDGTVDSYDGVVQDITDRKVAELRLLESEQRYREMFETSLDGIATTDLDGKIVDCNRAYVTLLGYTSPAEVITKTFRDVTPPEYHELDEKMIRRTNETGYCEIYEKEYLRRDGERYTANVRRWLRRDTRGLPVGQWVIARDITDKKRIDAEISRTEHLRSLSQLAGGIAHDFNNLLGGIFGYIDIAREFTGSPDKLKTYLEKALRSLHRARDLTERLLTFAKGDTPSRQLCSVASLLRDSVTLCLAGQSVRARLVVDNELSACEIDAAQIGRVINNLLMNAVQAMPDGGTVTIEATNCTIKAASGVPVSAGTYVKIVVRDAGTGIPQSIIDKVFDPFFTTKPKGTGLGLSICLSIIKKHDGHISIISREGKGTEVTLYLPSSSERFAESSSKTGRVTRGHGSILIMDDEEFVLDIASQMLLGMGYVVTTSRHGEEALTYYMKALDETSPFDAVILDLTIPGGMGGVKTCAKLRELNPTAKIVASSGYSTDPVMADPAGYGFIAMLKKPYIADDLAKVLKKVLRKHGSTAKQQGLK